MKLVFTRPAGQNQGLLDALPQHDCLELPLMTLQPLALTPEAKQQIMDLDLHDLLISTSPMASQCFIDQAEQYWPQWPIGLSALCPGPGSAKTLQQQGILCHWPEETNAQAMLSMPQLHKAERVLIARGQTSRQPLAEQLTQRGLRVSELILYRRQMLTPSLEQLQQLAHYDWLLISSQQGLEHLAKLLDDNQLACCPLLVSSPMLAQRANELGLAHRLCNGASDQHFIQVITQL